MGYGNLDLDEQPEEALRKELTRREELRAQGKCDYCEQPPRQPSCKERERHQRIMLVLERHQGWPNLHITTETFLKGSGLKTWPEVAALGHAEWVNRGADERNMRDIVAALNFRGLTFTFKDELTK